MHEMRQIIIFMHTKSKFTDAVCVLYLTLGYLFLVCGEQTGGGSHGKSYASGRLRVFKL